MVEQRQQLAKFAIPDQRLAANYRDVNRSEVPDDGDYRAHQVVPAVVGKLGQCPE
jgi:hypothetical protein